MSAKSLCDAFHRNESRIFFAYVISDRKVESETLARICIRVPPRRAAPGRPYGIDSVRGRDGVMSLLHRLLAFKYDARGILAPLSLAPFACLRCLPDSLGG